MKSKILSLSVIALALVGCGKGGGSKGSSAAPAPTGMCSQQTIDLHANLVNKSQKPLLRESRVIEIYHDCQDLKNIMGSNSCYYQTSNRGQGDVLSYSQVANFCAEVETYISQRNPPPAPVPVPTEPNPRPRPPRYNNVAIENIDNRYGVYFLKSHLQRHELDVRNGDTRCQINLPDSSNGYLRNSRASFVSVSFRMINYRSTYDITTMLNHSRDLVRITCRTQGSQLTVEKFNDVLDGLVEIRLRN